MSAIDIEVRYEPDHEVPTFSPGSNAMLAWGRHPEHGFGWTLYYLDDPGSETPGVDSYFIPGDLTDVDDAVESARSWLRSAWSER